MRGTRILQCSLSLLVILFATTGFAGKQRQSFRGTIYCDAGHFSLTDGRLVLVQGRGTPLNMQILNEGWWISSPYIWLDPWRWQGERPPQRWIAVEKGERGVSVQFVLDKTAATKWAIEVLSELKPATRNVFRGQLLDGVTGHTFRLSVDGKYITAGAPRHLAKDMIVRVLEFTNDPRKATVFTYIHTEYEIFSR